MIAAISRILYARATSANEVVIFQNRDDQNDFIAAGCLHDAAKARLVNGSGVDTGHFAAAPLPDKPIFLMMARLLVSKGVREYVDAALSILHERSDCRFLLAGSLDPSPDCIASSELEQWQERGIEYLGWVEDVRKALRQASVYVLPSYREGTPRTVLEAGAMGRPVITTDAPGCRETVIHGETGLLIPVRDPESLRAAMIAVADEPAERAAMGTKAREFISSKYAVGEVNATLMKHLGLEAR